VTTDFIIDGCCNSVKLNSDGGFGFEWSRYLGVWSKQGNFVGRPFYTCTSGCQGLDDNLIYFEGVWEIVDCFPGETGCEGIHEILISDLAPPSACPGGTLTSFVT